MNLELEDVSGSRFVAVEVATGDTRSEWRCQQLALRVSLVYAERCRASKGVNVTDAVVARAAKLAVSDHQRCHPRLIWRDVVISERHLRNAAEELAKVAG